MTNTLLSIAVLLFSMLSLAQAETHTFNWTTGWDYRNVDGLKSRPVITCNGQFPWPDITVNKGDRVQVYLTNGMNNTNTSMHFHGLFQNGTASMDGVPFLTQCPIAPGSTMLYNFTVDYNVGTYWYHSHTDGQYEDGMKGLFIIKDDSFPYDYDEELSLSLSEWYHDLVTDLTKSFMSVYNPTGAEPIPQNLIVNNTMNLTWEVQPDTTYLLRIVNVGGFVSQYFWIEDHEMTVVEIDGITTEKNVTDMLYITVAQRYTVLVHTKNDTDKNFAIMQKFDDTMLDVIPSDLQLNATSYMVYNKTAALPTQNYVDSIDNFLDDFYLQPYEKEAIYGEPDHVITVDVVMDNLKNGVNYAFFNNITYTAPKVPILMTVLSSGDQANNSEIYGSNTHTFILEKDEIVEIVLNNQDTGTHPFHLHGHAFQTIQRDRTYDDALGEVPHSFDPDNHPAFPEYPMRRDTLYVRPQSNFVIRFKADNPGVWFFHCHIEWHLLQGLGLVLVEDPFGIQDAHSQQISENHLEVCQSCSVATEGNAAANTLDLTDLTGENVQHAFIPTGFTKKGIIAMTFSCFAGILGIITIAIYGMMDMEDATEKVIRDLHVDPEVLLNEVDENEEREVNEDRHSTEKHQFLTKAKRFF
ncbi:AVN_HP_G0082750.mRNA.1.CDS.1 [Saccharomyces cerevisiae]|nr:CQI_4a_G0040700.mRNA.1.CDS.1 [Saccharomyces cerevisiae]CAI4989649.1 BEM_HP_G0172630.mRNA.1.CDS.1 [Saccharomyces cerevisiae]CAI4993147.1 BEM_HP_G0175490.mRNA.1.CDS.1 [Saccharomyces cerevisiae]CAI4995295.1 AVN_HP_G0039020.mRNA.1.CDS.1 [Saccharomyces cerevisiae]CAI5015429.1 AVN_HP_G0057000.mRNA.1.CDS.1 [Saccharomyces cerevisiae]